MKLKLLKGLHLTARERQVLAYAIANNSDSAHSSKLNACNVKALGEGVYSATIWHYESAMSGRKCKRESHVEVLAY